MSCLARLSILAVVILLLVESVLCEYALYSREPGIIKPARKAAKTRRTLRASDLKTSNYRKTASDAHSVGYAPSRDGRRIQSVASSSSKFNSLHADHIVEAQTVAKAMSNHGVSKSSSLMQFQSHPAVSDAKGILNSKNNLAFLDGKTNIAKGKLCAGQNCNSQNVGAARDYMRTHSAQAQSTSRQLQKTFDSHGLSGVSRDVRNAVNKDFSRGRRL
ncbi:hypothetical protein FISHEDRAFT_56021 [Fistulina hepatica ATCC 64428]|uniref:Uncharacterized protein n=1 Tax=Fistulina hepatica ATCC 64428 TaxID=1128425 RepID=A0A0D7AK90_9AGAR|nr:hypothetical protein FISHEDRAFT_56021 [Fistulina hepatica ATCC 64428]